MTISATTLDEIGSPGIRRSPRFLRARLPPPSASNVHETYSNANAQQQSRRLQFNDNVERVSTPSSDNFRPYTCFQSDTTSALAGARVPEAARYTDTSSLSPHAREGGNNNSNTETQPAVQGEIASAVANGIQSDPLQFDSVLPTEPGAVVLDVEDAASVAEKVRISAADEMTRVFGFVSKIPVKKI